MEGMHVIAGYSKGAEKIQPITLYWKLHCQEGACMYHMYMYIHHVIVQADRGKISERTTHATCLPLNLMFLFFFLNPLLTAYLE